MAIIQLYKTNKYSFYNRIKCEKKKGVVMLIPKKENQAFKELSIFAMNHISVFEEYTSQIAKILLSLVKIMQVEKESNLNSEQYQKELDAKAYDVDEKELVEKYNKVATILFPSLFEAEKKRREQEDKDIKEFDKQ